MDRLPGFRDFYPDPLPASELWSASGRQHIFSTWRRVAIAHGFREYDGPPLEPLELFTAKSGDEIVGQLYNFTDKGERAVALRPEMTPTLARMVAARERSYRKPMKWFALPQLFRYERQQKGRLREHFQFNADIFGESDPAADAELVALLIDALRAFGLTDSDFVIRLSSRAAWTGFLRQHQVDSARDYEFYQVIDKLERETPEQSDAKLKPLGLALDPVRRFIEAGEPTAELRAILDNLESRGLGAFVRIDYGVIRGLAYYTGPVFEAFDRRGEFRAIAGGGRYDQLVKLVSDGKVDLPGLGFGMGDVVLTELLKSRGLMPVSGEGLDLFVLVEDESVRSESLRLLMELRGGGLVTEHSLAPLKPDKQFRRALDLKARLTVRLERSPEGGWRVRIRDLATRDEQVVPRDVVVAMLQRTLAKERPPAAGG
jgi:histidyl-tRNA synthetase